MAAFPRISNAILVGLTFISLFSAYPAHAAMNPADGKRLQTLFTDMIKRYSNEAKIQGGQIITEGEVMVEPSDTYFAITLPHITAIAADQSKTNLGMISINALPGDTKEEWKMTVAMPTPVTMFGPDGKQTGTVEIGSQNFAGVFHEQFRNFVRLNAQYKNTVYTDTANSAKVTIPELSVIYDLKETGGNLWSGPMSAKASNVLGIFSKTGTTVKVRDISLQSTIKDYSVKEAIAYQDKINAFLESFSKDKPSTSPQHAQGMYNTIFDFMTKAWDGFGSSITATGIEVAKPAAADSLASTVKVERIGFGLEGNGFRTNKVTLHPTLNVTNISMTPPPTGINKAMPNTINIDMTINNLPFKQLAEWGQKTLGQGTTSPEATANNMATAKQMMTDSGTSLTVKNTNVGNGTDYDILLNGTATSNNKSAFGATAKTRLEIFGIEKLIAYMQQANTDPTLSPQTKAQAQQFLQTFTILQMVGQQGKNAKGQDIRAYNLELSADGKTMLNGADLMSVLGPKQ